MDYQRLQGDPRRQGASFLPSQELAGALDHQIGSLVHQEVAGVGDELDAHVVGVALVARQELLGYVAVTLAEEQESGDREPGSAPAARGALAYGALVVAVELPDRAGAHGVAEALRVELDL